MSNSEIERLENLWSGTFGDEYCDRNRNAGDVREEFWTSFFQEFPCKSSLEIGCNVGANLKWIKQCIEPHSVYGIEINKKALIDLRRSHPEINATWGQARNLPFRDNWFDLVFTMGVLIHQPDISLPLVMSEMVRCSNQYVFCGEYFSEQREEVQYRNHNGALIKRDYGNIFLELFPNLSLVKKGFLSRDSGWDDITFWLFQINKSQ